MRCLFAITLMTIMSLAGAQAEVARDSQLCLSQLELLLSGDKLSEAEAEVFRKQCACLEAKEASGEATSCAQERGQPIAQ